MAILSDLKIKEAVKNEDIIIEDFDESRLGPNSYNLRLGSRLLIYTEAVLDMKKENPTTELTIPEEGMVLYPGILYLGETMEYTDAGKYLMIMHGRSSMGRLGIEFHVCAGLSDIGFKGRWTLEIRVIHPVRVYAGTEVCQILFEEMTGEVEIKYHGKYQNSKRVIASRINKDFEPGKGYQDIENKSNQIPLISDKFLKDSDTEKLNLYNATKTIIKDIFKEETELEKDYIQQQKTYGLYDNMSSPSEYNLKKKVVLQNPKSIDLRKLNNFIIPNIQDILSEEFINNGQCGYLEKSGVYMDMIKLREILDEEISKKINAPYVLKNTILIENCNPAEAIELDPNNKTITLIPEYRDKSKDRILNYNPTVITSLKIKYDTIER